MLNNYRVKGAARQVYSDMQMARLRAIKEGEAGLQWSLQAPLPIVLKAGLTLLQPFQMISPMDAQLLMILYFKEYRYCSRLFRGNIKLYKYQSGIQPEWNCGWLR